MIVPATLHSLAVQRNILLVPFKGINPGNAVLYAVILHIAGRCQSGSVIDGEQHFLVIPVRRRRENFLAGQLQEIRPRVQSHGFNYLCRAATAFWRKGFPIPLFSGQQTAQNPLFLGIPGQSHTILNSAYFLAK